MKGQLIVYKLDSGNDDSKIVEKIKSYSTWARVTDNCWIIVADKSSGAIRDELKEVIEGKGKVLVINVTGQSWGTYAVSKEVTDWMKTNLK